MSGESEPDHEAVKYAGPRGAGTGMLSKIWLSIDAQQESVFHALTVKLNSLDCIFDEDSSSELSASGVPYTR